MKHGAAMNSLINFYRRHQGGFAIALIFTAFVTVSTMDAADIEKSRELEAQRSAEINQIRHSSLCIHDSSSPFCKGVIR